MIEALKEFFNELKDNETFKTFKEKNSLAYNTSACLINEELQLDFYDPNEDKITSFTKKEGKIVSQESEVFRKEKKEIEELNLDKIKITLEKAEEMIKEKYQDKPTKKIFILQQKKFPIWNITYLTPKLDILNVKINATSGEIIEEKIESALGFQKH